MTNAADRKAEVLRLWTAGVDAVGGYAATARALAGLDTPPDQILAVGKAAGTMARAARDRYGAVPTLVVTKDGHGEGLPADVTLIEASHPVPDARSLVGGRALRHAVEGMQPGSELLLLVSGGASSLAEDPVGDHDLSDIAALNTRLLASGLDIQRMNAERRKLSRIKGGGLLGHFRGASVRMMAISDVPHDDIAVIGSGIGAAPENRDFDYHPRIVASNTHARDAAAAALSDVPLLANEETLYGDVAALAGQIGPRLRAMPPGAMILGGEPTVVLPRDPGQGGRNQALALEVAREIAGTRDLTVIVAGTDGSDGPTDAAGGIVDGDTWAQSGQDALDRADSGPFLAGRGALLTTGPTGTNVMDLLIALRG